MTDDRNWVRQVLTSPRMAALDPPEQIVTHLRQLLTGLASDHPMTANEIALEAGALLTASRASARGKDSE